jgi:hypothetical protein
MIKMYIGLFSPEGLSSCHADGCLLTAPSCGLPLCAQITGISLSAQTSPSYKDTCQLGFIVKLMASLSLNHVFKGLIYKHSHILK